MQLDFVWNLKIYGALEKRECIIFHFFVFADIENSRGWLLTRLNPNQQSWKHSINVHEHINNKTENIYWKKVISYRPTQQSTESGNNSSWDCFCCMIKHIYLELLHTVIRPCKNIMTFVIRDKTRQETRWRYLARADWP